ncbi:MAG: hypothetical protein HIU83_05760 [Proteobacteria bacterium]|nr:hypothetical protein [Pseudomonadota bacterium]
MNRTIGKFNIIIAALLSLTLAACGGGSSSQQTTSTVITGVASKGLIRNGVVKVYAVSAGAKGALLITTSTDANGWYSANIGTYTGAVLVEASGSYSDEATGQIKTIDPATPLRAAIGNASGAVSLSVTPLTDIAVSLAPTLTPAAIDAANAQITSIFKVDIVATTPVDATASAMASATQAQKDYTLALAAVSQLAENSSSTVQQTMTTIQSGITSSGANQQTVTTLTTALSVFLTSDSNQTGVTTLSGSSLVNLGKQDITLVFSIQGNIPSSGSGGAQFTFTLPAGVSIQAADGELSATIIKAAGVAASGATVSGKLAGRAVTAALIASSPVSTGDFMTITCLADPGVLVTADLFSLSGVKIIDINGAAISTATVEVLVR